MPGTSRCPLALNVLFHPSPPAVRLDGFAGANLRASPWELVMEIAESLKARVNRNLPRSKSRFQREPFWIP